jgi:zinc finger SWIM domain-containing protein 3
MKVNLCKNGAYKVSSFFTEHNHPLATLRKRIFLRSHRDFNAAHKAVADIADNVGLKPKEAYDFMAKQVGGRRHLSFLPDDYRNYLRSKRMNAMLLGDGGAIMQYLQNCIKEDPQFYCNVQLDEEDMITNIFWANGRSLMDYACFGDVVCFDTTYKTNGYGGPLALIVGVNHHKGTIIFGAAFLFDEKKESFQWLFETFTHAVGGKAPQVILTDQDKATANAINVVWPETTHRLCVWHMYQNAAKHLSHVFSGFRTFKKEFSHCVYDCQYEEEFLASWKQMLTNYELYDNEWLGKLFEERKKWALVYGRRVFCADMKST